MKKLKKHRIFSLNITICKISNQLLEVNLRLRLVVRIGFIIPLARLFDHSVTHIILLTHKSELTIIHETLVRAFFQLTNFDRQRIITTYSQAVASPGAAAKPGSQGKKRLSSEGAGTSVCHTLI